MNALFSLLSYRAFRPDPLDIDEPISSRFRLRKFLGIKRGTNRLLVLSVGRSHWRATIATFDKAGAPAFSEVATSPNASNRDNLIEWLREYAGKHKVEHVAVGLGHGFIVSAISAVQRISDVETMRLLRTEPTRIFGESNANTEEVNSLVHHPDVDNSSLRFRLRASELNAVREVCNACSLAIVRLVSEQAQLLELAYVAGLGREGNVRGVLLAQSSSFLFVPLDGTGWHSVVFDPALDDQASSAIHHAAGQAIPQGGALAYIDAGMPGFGDIIQSLGSYTPVDLLRGHQHSAFIATLLN